ncbi:MAG: NAD(P)/FAD-dependent oxidoreductase [Myxococcaceae bacterium]
MNVGRSLAHEVPAGPFDVICVGSGFGALSAAALLAKEGGKRVLVLEQHYRIGGFTHVFTRPGYEWDVGVHYVGQVGPGELLEPLFTRLTGGALRWARLPDVVDSIELGTRRFSLRAGKTAFVEELTRAFGGGREALERYVARIGDVASDWQRSLMVRAVSARGVTRTVKDAERTTNEVLRELGLDEVQRAVVTGNYGDYGVPPARSSFAMHAAVADHYLGGAWYPVGGASQLAKTLAGAIEGAGGKLVTSARVTRLLVEQGRVTGVEVEGGHTFRAGVVISGAGVRNTQRLIPEAHRPAEWTAKLATVESTPSWLCLYLGFRRSDAELGLTGTNLFIHPDEQLDANVARFDADPRAPLPVVYVSFPSAKDPDFARRRPGRATVEVIVPARWDWFSKWASAPWQKRGAEYDELKRSWTTRMLDALFARLPQLKGQVDHAELSTPLSAAHFSGHERGELYGLAGTPARFESPFSTATPLEGLLLTGIDTGMPGVGGAAFSGALAAAAVLGARRLLDWLPPPARGNE